MRFLNQDIAKQPKMLPTLITGDWNSYIKEQTGGTKDDIEIFEDILSKNTRRFRTITPNIASYYGGAKPRTLDHIVVTSDIQALAAWGYEACKETPDYSKRFIPHFSYQRHYTDHCPVSAFIKIKG